MTTPFSFGKVLLPLILLLFVSVPLKANTEDIYRIPKCSSPEFVQLAINNEGIQSITWKDVPAKIDDVRYQIRYRHKGSDWTYLNIFEGTNIPFEENLLELDRLEIRKICDGYADMFSLTSEWVRVSHTGNHDHAIDTCYLFNYADLRVSGPYAFVTMYGPAPMNGRGYIIEYKFVGIQTVFLDTLRNFSSVSAWMQYLHVIPLFNEAGSLALERLEVRFAYGAKPVGGPRNDPNCPTCFTDLCDPIDLLGPEGESDFPNCDEDFSWDTPTGPLKSDLQKDDVFFAYGFPIIVESLQSGGGQNTYNGTGIIALPFQDKKAHVGFSNIGVNDSLKMVQGEVYSISGPDSVLYEIINGMGGVTVEICLDPEEYQVEVREGFDENGHYIVDPPYTGYEPGDPFHPECDPNGFNAYGIHCATGTPYNEKGCSVEGISDTGEPCDPEAESPYYWLGENGGTNAGLQFWEEIKGEFDDLLDSLITEIQNKLQDSLTNTEAVCNNLRTSMNSLVTFLNLDRDFIFGEGDKYFASGMHSHFVSTPQASLVSGNQKSSEQRQLENEHVELYHCDKKETQFADALNKVIALLSDQSEFDDLSLVIEQLIKVLNEASVEQFKANHQAFYSWLVDLILNNLDINGGLLATNTLPPADSGGFYPVDLSSNLGWGNFNNKEYHKAQVLFEYHHNFEYVNSIPKYKIIGGVAEGLSQISRMSGEPASFFPAKISKEIFGLQYTLYLDNLILTPTSATIDVYFLFEVPGSGDILAFKLEQAGITPSGPDEGDTKLYLINDQEIKLSNSIKIRVNGGSNTYVHWDCSGYAGMRLDVDLEVCRNYLTPLDQNFTPIEDEEQLVTTNLVMEFYGWGDSYFQLNLPPFAVTKFPHIGFSVTNAIFDMSDVVSPQGAVFPEMYHSPFVFENAPTPMWKGIYIQNVNIVINDAAESIEQSSQPIQISGTNFFFDDRGFTGEIDVTAPIVSLEDGTIGSWAFSIDGFNLRFIMNQLMEGGFNGKINIPLFHSSQGEDTISPEDCFDYTAKLSRDKGYTFSLSGFLPEYNVPFLLGTAVINEGSHVFMEYDEEIGFNIVATLSGKIDFDGDLSPSSKLNLPDLKVQGLKVSNQEPYIRNVGFWATEGEIGGSVAGFGLSIDQVKMQGGSGNHVGLNLVANVLLGTNNFNIDAKGDFKLDGVIDLQDGRQRWNYDGFRLNEFTIDTDIKDKFRLKGGIKFFEDHSTFGTGFYGDIELALNFFDSPVGIAAAASFGRSNPGMHNEFRYFYVDMLANLPGAGIPLGGININAIRGGVYNRMSRNEQGVHSFPATPSNEPLGMDNPGQTPSGITYSPDINTGLGFLAGIHFSTVNEKLISGNVTLEVAFNSSESSNSGIKKIAMEGSARILDVPDMEDNFNYNDSLPPDIEGIFVANARFVYNFNDREFSGRFDAFLNAGIVRGMGPNGRVGQGKLHFGRDKWYVYIGTPDHPFGVRMGLGPVSFDSKSYFCIGTEIPNMPRVPAKAQSIAGSVRDAGPLRESGRGMVFGSSFKFSTGDLRFLIFRASFGAEAGFDVMFKDHRDLICVNNNNKPIGINGWYFTGQYWAYMEGNIAIRFRGKNRTIISLAAGVILQGGGPEPFFATGRVGGEYRILGGLVKGRCSFKIDLGERCEPQEGYEEEFDVIVDFYPEDGADNIDVFEFPQAFFALPVGESIEVESIDGESSDEYELIIKSTKLTYRTHLISGKADASGIFVVEYQPDWVLPEKDTLTFEVTVDIVKNGNFLESQSRSAVFVTGIGPDIIPQSNVVATYPINGMRNFHPKENKQGFGYIKLKSWQYQLLSNPKDFRVQITSEDGYIQRLPVEFVLDKSMVRFPISSAALNPGGFYKLDLVEYNSGSQLPSGFASVSGENDLNPLTKNDYRSLYSLKFRVSNYETFVSKLQSLFGSGTIMEQGAFPGPTFYYHLANFEGFDILEISEKEGADAMLEFKIGGIGGEEWFLSHIHPVYLMAKHFFQNNPQVLVPFIGLPNFANYHPITNNPLSATAQMRGGIPAIEIPQEFSAISSSGFNFHMFNIKDFALYHLEHLFDVFTMNCSSGLPIWEDGDDEIHCPPLAYELGQAGLPTISNVTVPVTFTYRIPYIGVTTNYTTPFTFN